MSAASDSPALVALAHGSRDPRSAAAIRRLVEEVRSLRPGLTLEAAFLELSEPGFDDVVARLAELGTRDVVVVPLLLTEAYHARVDLPAAVDRAGSRHPGVRILRAGVLGTDDALLDVLDRRLASALSEGDGPDGLVLTSAGSSDDRANEQVAGLARRWGARHGLPAVAAFASAARPDPGEAVHRLHAEGSRRVAVGRLFLAPGTLADRAAGQAHDAGARAVAEVLGPDPTVAGLVLARFDAVAEEGAPVGAWQDTAPAPYPSGLRLRGRRVVVVGGGTAAQRRVPALLAAGADVTVVAPWLTPALEGLVGSGEVRWRPGVLVPADLEEAWYVVAAAVDPVVDAATVAAAEERRLFCERVADPDDGSATAPAVGRHGGLTVAVHGELTPRRLAEVRDLVLDGLGRADVPVPRREQRPGVVLVGGGPGDPELVTVAGRRALAEADVVVADRLAPRELLAGLAADVEVVDVAKLPRGRASTQEQINAVLVDRVRAGKRVVRLKGGDSFVFGRGFEEVQACADAGVPVSVVPGLSSAMSVPGLAGIPVTHRGIAHEVTVVSGHVPPGAPSSLVDWDALARLRGTLVLLMAVENLPAIAEHLVLAGRSAGTPVAVLVEGSLPGERRLLSTLGEVAADVRREGLRPPAVVVVGDVVGVAHPERYAPVVAATPA